jgi:hypothetical protein
MGSESTSMESAQLSAQAVRIRRTLPPPRLFLLDRDRLWVLDDDVAVNWARPTIGRATHDANHEIIRVAKSNLMNLQCQKRRNRSRH